MGTLDTGNLESWLKHVHQSHYRLNWDFINGKPCFWYITDGLGWSSKDKQKEIFDLTTGKVRFEKVEE